MTTPPAPGVADAARSPLWLLAVPYGLMFAIAALTPAAEFRSNQGDVGLYLQKAQAVGAGLLPYRDFPLEYPPLALLPMAVPYLLWPFGGIDLDLYRWLFVGWEAALLVALGLVLFRLVRLGADLVPTRAGEVGAPATDRQLDTGVRLIVLTAGAALALAWRFDLFPALLVMVALWHALAGRAGLAGIVVGLGVLAKLYPIVVVPAIAVMWLAQRDLDRTVRFGAAVAITGLVGMLPFVAVAGSDALFFLEFQAERGLQIESLGGGLVVLFGLVAGQPPPINHHFSSVQVAGPLADAWLALLPVLTAVGFAALGWLGWRRVRADMALDGAVHPRTVMTLAAASVLVLLVTSKVFSIQYVVWVVPFAALLGWRLFAVAALLTALTMPIHPGLYGELVRQEALPVLILNLRNALVVVLLGGLMLSLRPTSDGKEEWRARRDSNPRPSGPQPDALSAELRAHAMPSVSVRETGGEGGIRTLGAGYPTQRFSKPSH